MTSSLEVAFDFSTSAVADDLQLRSKTWMTWACRTSETSLDLVLRGLLAPSPRS